MNPVTGSTGKEQGEKRKALPAGSSQPQKKPRRDNDPRTVLNQKTQHVLNNGELDLAKFVKAREFEIGAMERSMRAASKMRNNRAFQQVPRELRRRTASHNAKKVPRRLRPRARREAWKMQMDNTPTVERRRRKALPHQHVRLQTARRIRLVAEKTRKRIEERQTSAAGITPGKGDDIAVGTIVGPRSPRAKCNSLRAPDMPKAKFRKRQKDKTWLPTHLYHAKRAHMTPPREPLWGFAMPVSPNLKSFRASHRASKTSGAIAWDASYMSTIGLSGQEKSLQGLLKALGVGPGDASGTTWGRQGLKWRLGLRAWHGWLFERQKSSVAAIAPATVLWQRDGQPGSPPSTAKSPPRKIFLRVHPSAFKQLWNELLNVAKVQKPAVTVEDLRFEVGSIEVAGPQATEALVGTLYPVSCDSEPANKSAEPSAANLWKELAPVTNPAALPHSALIGFNVADPRLWWPPRKLQLPTPEDSEAQATVLRICSEWPFDRTQSDPSLFDRRSRLAAQRSMRSQKSINRRKGAAGPGKYPEYESSDPRIPVLLYAGQAQAGDVRWHLLLPWRCVSAVWTSLMAYGLSTGGRVRLGCLAQHRQIAFESGTPWFPGDFPGTGAGNAWEERERAIRKAAWERRPKGRRLEYDSITLGPEQKGELGRGWACDWQYICKDLISELEFPQFCPQQCIGDVITPDTKLGSTTFSRAIITVRLVLVGRGTPEPCARIYRLPSNDDKLKQQWRLVLETRRESAKQHYTLLERPAEDAPQSVWNEYLARSILQTPEAQPGSPPYPHVPAEDDLIGFVTTANFNLGQGKCVAIGSLRLSRVMEGTRQSFSLQRSRLCIVRDAGQSVGRLAKWELC